MGKDCQLAELPERLWHKIVGFLDSKELCHLSQVCRSLNGVAADDRVWQTLFTKYYKAGELPIPASTSWRRLCSETHKATRSKLRPSNDSTSASPHTPSSVSSESEPRDAKSPAAQDLTILATAAPPPAPAAVAPAPSPHESPAVLPSQQSPSDGAARSGMKPSSTTVSSSHHPRSSKHAIAPSAETQHISSAPLSEQNEIVDIEGGDEPVLPKVAPVVKISPPRVRQPASSPPRTFMDVSKLPLRKRFFKENMEFRTSTDSVRSSAGLADSASLSSSAAVDQHASNNSNNNNNNNGNKPDVAMADVDGGVTISHDSNPAPCDSSVPHPRKARLQAFAGTAAAANLDIPSEPAPRPVTPVPRPVTPVNHAEVRHDHPVPAARPEPPKPTAASPAACVVPKPKATTGTVLKRKSDEVVTPTATPKAKEAKAKQPKKNAAETKRAHKEKGEPELYCFCRKPYDPAIFMIACDVCDEWYHGHCVGVREEDAANYKSYSCPDCRQESEDVEFEEDASGAIKSKKKKAGHVPKRCLNASCAQLAKSKSKYCSNACGVAVARETIRKKEGGRAIEPCASSEQPAARADEDVVMDTPEDAADRKALDELKAKRIAAEKSLSQLERTFLDLDRAIAAPANPSSTEPMSPSGAIKAEVDESAARAATSDDLVDCVSCGNPLPVKNLARHLDQCFHPRGKPDVASVLALAGLVRDASGASPTPKMPKSPTKKDKDLLLCGFPTEEFGGGRCERLRKACTAHSGWEVQRKSDVTADKARVQQQLVDVARQEAALLAQIRRRQGGRTIQH